MCGTGDRGTGLAVVDARAEPMRLLASVTVKLGPKLEPYECLGRIADAVEALARAHHVTQAAIEETIYVQNFRTAQAMGASRGAALSVLARLGVKVGDDGLHRPVAVPINNIASIA